MLHSPDLSKLALSDCSLCQQALEAQCTSHAFPSFLFLRPTRVELFSWVAFQHRGAVMCPAAVQSPALSSHPVTSSSPCEEQECCPHHWWRATAQPRGKKGILGAAGSSLTKHDRQESQSSAKINPASAYDCGLVQPIADTAAQWETNFQITSCSAVLLSGMGFFLFFPSLCWVFLVVFVLFIFSTKNINVSPAASDTHRSYAEIQTYIVDEAVVQVAINFGAACFTCNLFSSCSPQHWDSTSTRKDLEKFWTLIKYALIWESFRFPAYFLCWCFLALCL